jgi:hypothetical protein
VADGVIVMARRRSRPAVPVLLLFASSCLPLRLPAAEPACRTFSSAGQQTIAVEAAYEGYFVVDFGAKDDAAADALAVFASRESPDGGSDIRRTYSRGDLPAELARGTVRGFEFTLASGGGSSSNFWVTLAPSAGGCPTR